MPTQETQPQKPASLAAWKKSKRHTITLPSATIVEIEVPDLPNMVRAGNVPNELLDAAIDVASGKKPTRDDIIQQADFFNRLAAWTVVEPKVTVENFENGDLPFEDKEMLVAIATRQTDIDAVGHHLAGLEKVKSFRDARGIFALDEDLES